MFWLLSRYSVSVLRATQLSFLIEIVLSVLLYVLLKPVSKTLALVAAFSRLAMTIVPGNQSAQSIFLFFYF